MARFQAMLGRMSGALGGVVFAHGPGGDYVRSRVSPVNPGSAQQQAIRNAVNYLSNRWQALSVAQRLGWEVYAANVTLPGRFGEPMHISAMSHYVRSNVTRMQIDVAATIVDAAPTVYNLGEFLPLSFSLLDWTTPSVSVAFDNTQDWCGEDASTLVLYTSKPKEITINYFKGPYRYNDRIDGDSVTPPTSPQVVTLPWLGGADDRGFFAARVTRADGRLSPMQRYTVDS